jgi:hypothetical protein
VVPVNTACKHNCAAAAADVDIAEMGLLLLCSQQQLFWHRTSCQLTVLACSQDAVDRVTPIAERHMFRYLVKLAYVTAGLVYLDTV